ncbi:MAG: ATP-binding protein [Halodesulfurarchaeum sp.]
MNDGFSDSTLLDRIFETSPTGIVVLTPDGQITRCNERAEDLLELDETDVEGKRYQEPEWEFTEAAGEPIAEAEHPFVRVRDSRAPIFNQEYRMQRPHADAIDVSISGAPILGEQGIERVVFAFEDVTERRERERELEVMTRQLEVLNRVVRHDIRNEMAVIIGFIETASAAVSDPKAKAQLDRALGAGQHIVSITEAARDLMELVTEPEPPDLDPIALRPILEEEIELTREEFPEATVEIEGELPEVSVRATRLLDSVFRNLLGNAISHNDTDSPTVTASTTVEDDRVRISIADDGPGIPEERKWEIFGKGDMGLESEGTGIGLYLAESLVAQFGGDIWVEDNEPRGAVFVVELAVAEE